MTTEELEAMVASLSEDLATEKALSKSLKESFDSSELALKESRENNSKLLSLIPVGNLDPNKKDEPAKPEITTNELIKEYLGGK